MGSIENNQSTSFQTYDYHEWKKQAQISNLLLDPSSLKQISINWITSHISDWYVIWGDMISNIML